MPKPGKKYSYIESPKVDIDVKTVFDWVSRLEVVTTNPDGSRVGKYTGEAVLLSLGGNYYIEVCVGGGTTNWRGTILFDVP